MVCVPSTLFGRVVALREVGVGCFSLAGWIVYDAKIRQSIRDVVVAWTGNNFAIFVVVGDDSRLV